MAQNVVIDLSSMKAANDVTLQKEDNTTTTKMSLTQVVKIYRVPLRYNSTT